MSGFETTNYPNTPSSGDPYALENLLPAGTIQVELGTADISCPSSPQVAAEDGWHPLSNVNPEIALPTFRALVQTIQFLTRYRFISATYKSAFLNRYLVIRIYIIPFDLPGVHGSLTYHVRKCEAQQVLSMARQYMSVLLPQIVQDQASWNHGLLHTELGSPIIDCCSVSKLNSGLTQVSILYVSRIREHSLKSTVVFLLLLLDSARL